ECLRTGWISSAGRFIDEFESQWAAYCGMTYGIAVSNGTVALEVAVRCLDLQPGDEVIMPTFTIISCAQPVVQKRGVPVLVDAEPRTWCMDVTQLEAKITPRTRAIMPVHIYGHPVDMDPICELAARHHLVIIEDAAEVHGAEYLSGRGAAGAAWRRCGGLGHISTFSFYANKLVTTGEGGMVLTSNADWAEKARSFRNLCFRPERRFLHSEIGQNYRLTNLQAALGVAQIERIAEIIARKRWMGQAYTEQLRGIPGLQLPLEESWARHVYWMYGLVLDEATGMNAVDFARRLKEQGVDTRPFFLGMHEQPVFQGMGLFKGERYPVAERIARQGLYLPSGLALTEDQLNRVCETVRTILTR
ncbi:MAG: DegT/DnrJ/EryC1/StrS family aminotransferase, partial [Chloroflexi bacterium]|nr:DegT/DnrJ/EryC1/StrS family aminotransferase [Chloroflexota bacterium]